jgi:hypothetical protein
MMRRLSLPAGCGGCSVRGKPRRCLRVRHRCPCAVPRGRSTGLGVAGFAIRFRRDRHRPRASPRSPNGPIRARLKPPESPTATRTRTMIRLVPDEACGMGAWGGPLSLSTLTRHSEPSEQTDRGPRDQNSTLIHRRCVHSLCECVHVCLLCDFTRALNTYRNDIPVPYVSRYVCPGSPRCLFTGTN